MSLYYMHVLYVVHGFESNGCEYGCIALNREFPVHVCRTINFILRGLNLRIAFILCCVILFSTVLVPLHNH